MCRIMAVQNLKLNVMWSAKKSDLRECRIIYVLVSKTLSESSRSRSDLRVHNYLKLRVQNLSARQ